jgi:hypothetical protein
MERTCSLESMVRESTDRRPADREQELGVALRAAVVSTQAKIEHAFVDRGKFRARLKSA